MEFMSNITCTFLKMKNIIQLYHWQTKSFSRHKASDELLSNLSTKIDSFIETMQGLYNNRVHISGKTNMELYNYNDEQIIAVLEIFKKWLQEDVQLLFSKNTDLLNIRDDMLIDINKTLYLFTFS